MDKNNLSKPRKAVVELLIKVDENKAYSNILLDDTLKKNDFDSRDKKFITALFYGVLEQKITLDAVIYDFLNEPNKELPSQVMNNLRAALYQILYMNSVPDSAAVNQAVKIAKSFRKPLNVSLINALLRNFIRKGKKLPCRDTKEENLSLEYSCPLWLVKKWLDEYGEEVCMQLLETSMGQAPISVKANTLKLPIEDIERILTDDGFKCEKVDIVDDALRIYGSGSIENSKAYKTGLVHVQDISSQICCKCLDAKPGDTVLDICSAPGGKAFTISENMKNKGLVMAFDLHENRVKLIRKGAERLGLSIITADTNNGKVFNPDLPLADRVLCDVPCSGLGVIRRKPEIKYKEPKDFERLPEIQYDILETSSRYVKVGGTLVYSTCTISKNENYCVVKKFLENNADFEAGVLPEFLETKKNYISITPGKFNSDGFFIAIFKRIR